MPTRDTRRAAHVAHRLGRSPKPYQLGMIERLSAPHPDDPGGYAARVAVVLAPRRTGKTTSILDMALGRCVERGGFAAAYTAQTGHAVTELFAEPGGLLDQIEGVSIGRGRWSARRSAGTERARFTRGAVSSFVGAFPPVPGKLRGRARHLVVIDEAQELDAVLGALLADVMPTGDTLGRVAQLVVTGTAGKGPGPWHDMVDRARAGELPLVELGTWPDDADPDDPDTWARYHPGVRSGLTTLDALRDARGALGVERFAREYGNRWGSLDATTRPIPPDRFAAAAVPDDVRPGRPAAVGFDVTLDRSSATLVGVTDTGHVRVLAVCHPRQIPERLDQLGRVPVAAPPAQRPVTDELVRRGRAARALTPAEYRAACQTLADRVEAGELTHNGQPELVAAVESADRSWHGDQWVISSRRSGGDVSALVAASCAVYESATARRPRVVSR